MSICKCIRSPQYTTYKYNISVFLNRFYFKLILQEVVSVNNNVCFLDKVFSPRVYEKVGNVDPRSYRVWAWDLWFKFWLVLLSYSLIFYLIIAQNNASIILFVIQKRITTGADNHVQPKLFNYIQFKLNFWILNTAGCFIPIEYTIFLNIWILAF